MIYYTPVWYIEGSNRREETMEIVSPIQASPEVAENLENRLARIEGQVRGVRERGPTRDPSVVDSGRERPPDLLAPRGPRVSARGQSATAGGPLESRARRRS